MQVSVEDGPIPNPAAEAADPMVTIGVFARKSRLSMRALRLYDKLGLLRPVRQDPGNGYRWYRLSQLKTAQLIAMLRRLDMPLSQVAEVVAAAGGPTAAESASNVVSPRSVSW